MTSFAALELFAPRDRSAKDMLVYDTEPYHRQISDARLLILKFFDTCALNGAMPPLGLHDGA
jgi:hypothetical protein